MATNVNSSVATDLRMGRVAGNRWVQLVCGVIAMIVISNYQYAFTLFTPGMKLSFPGVPYAKIAAVFSAFILFETWPMPVAGYFVDRFGIRKLMTFGALCIALGWVLGGTVARSPLDLYIYYGVIAGTGAGIIYISCIANAVKWFPDRRGLAAGLTAAGFGGGAALTVIPIASTIHSMGWARAMAVWGVAQGIIALGAALILRHPPAGWVPAGWGGMCFCSRPAARAKSDTLGLEQMLMKFCRSAANARSSHQSFSSAAASSVLTRKSCRRQAQLSRTDRWLAAMLRYWPSFETLLRLRESGWSG